MILNNCKQCKGAADYDTTNGKISVRCQNPACGMQTPALAPVLDYSAKDRVTKIWNGESEDAPTGAEPTGATADDPIAYVYGMDCFKGKYYSYGDKVWLCSKDMTPCTWEPGAAGVHWWGEVK